MPFFSPKTWKQRIVEFPGRRRLDDTSSADVYDVSRAEGIVTQEGDGFTAVNMNDLEQRINNAVNDVAGLNAEEYDPKSTYKKGALRTNNNALWKAKENIDTPEQWTPEHWELTTLAAELSALNSSCLKVRVAKMLSTGAWMDPNTVKAIDIDVSYQDGDICVAFNSNNTGASNLIYTPCVDNGKWLVTVNANSKGGGPDTFRVIILNT